MLQADAGTWLRAETDEGAWLAVWGDVLPRYAAPRKIAGREIADRFWPKPVDLTQPVETDDTLAQAVHGALAGAWRRG